MTPADAAIAEPIADRSAQGQPADLAAAMGGIGRRARAAAAVVANSSDAQRREALQAAAAAIRAGADRIAEANARDVELGREKGLSAALLDRLLLTPARIESMAAGVEAVAALPDPVGRTLAAWDRPNGLRIERRSVPIGVIAIVYESRPNVTADAGSLCLRAGNVAILRGGSESFHSSGEILAALRAGLSAADLPADALQSPPSRDRAAVGHLLRMAEFVDVVVPRGGRSLIERVMAESRVPVLAHLEGLNHTYLHAAADLTKARAITLNAKMRRVSVCGATETLLVDASAAARLLPPVLDELIAAGCEVRGCPRTRGLDARVKAATEEDWRTEYLEAILAVRVVDGLEGALDHIARYGSRHTEAIVTEDPAAAEAFLTRVDAAIVLHNASTQFADGGEFGMGAEIGIATGKLPPRGPVGAEQLTSYKYLVRGDGQTRP